MVVVAAAGHSAAQEAAQTAIITLVNGSDANRSLTIGAGALERLAASLAAGEMTPEREHTRNAVILLRSLIFNSEANRERFPGHGVAPLVRLLDAGGGGGRGARPLRTTSHTTFTLI